MTGRQALLVPLFAVVTSTTGMAQRPVTDPETIAGPWEVSGPSWTEGVFFSISTYRSGRVDRQTITNQDIHVQVYHRRDGRSWWGWVTPKAEDDYYATFDGRHLRTRAGFTLDVMFDPDRQHWSGTWNRDGQEATVILERPHPSPGSPVSPFCGQWQGVAENANSGFFGSLQLHIAQSRDATLTAWTNRSDERHGQLFRVVSVDQDTITMQSDAAGYPGPRYAARLTAGGSELVGTWEPGHSLTSLAGDVRRFRKVESKSCD